MVLNQLAWSVLLSELLFYIISMNQQRLVLANWKMNGTLATNQQLLQDLHLALTQAPTQTQVALCVPYPYLAQTQQSLAGGPIQWGAQNLSEHSHGAYTGEVSAQMLTDFDCSWVLVGHSERRQLHAESDQQLIQKTLAAVAAGLKAVVCVGETEAQYSAGQTQTVIQQQLQAVLQLDSQQLKHVVIAYEPVWAIGTGKSATPEQAQQVHAYIRQLFASKAPRIPIVYGGSVNAQNAAALFAQPDINGALVGGASLNANEFLSIVTA